MIALTPSGVSSYIKSRLQATFPVTKPAPPSVATGSGTPAIYKPPTVQAPPSAVAAVSNQLATSNQLMENTVTGAGTGAGTSSFPITKKIINGHAIALIAGLAIALVFALAYDRKA